MYKFDLFELHDCEQDKRTRGWVKLGGKRLIEKVKNILLEEIKKGETIHSISDIVAKNIDVDQYTVFRALNPIINDEWKRRKNYIAIQILKGLINVYNLEKQKWKYIDLTESIISGASRSKPVKAVKTLTKELAIIAGVYAADGTLSRYKIKENSYQYRIMICDEYKSSLDIIKELINRIFNLEVEIKKSKYDNSYLIVIDSKVICRYFNKFLKFKYGKKTTTINIPQIIKDSNLEIQKSFVKGFVTFDGCIDMGGYFRLSIKNKRLIEEINNIMKKDGITIDIKTEITREGVNNIRSSVLKDKKFLDYFLKGSIKYERAKFFVNGDTNIDIFDLFSERSTNKINLKKLFEEIKLLKVFPLSKIRDETRISERTLRNYLRILVISGKLNEVKNRSKLDCYLSSLKNLDDTTAIKLNEDFRKEFFNNLLSKYMQKDIATKINTNSETISGWKYGKFGIDNKFIKRLLRLSDFQEKDLLNSIESLNKNLYIINNK